LGDSIHRRTGPIKVIQKQNAMSRDSRRADFESAFKKFSAFFCIVNVLQLTKLPQFAYRVMRHWYFQALAKSVREPCNRLELAVDSSWRNRNDNGWVNAPAADEIRCRLDKFVGGRLVGAILKAEKQLADLGTMRLELRMTEFVITDESASCGMKVEYVPPRSRSRRFYVP
jgi:hypothetical protein